MGGLSTNFDYSSELGGAKARAYNYPAKSQSYAQVVAERANLQAARMAKGTARGTSSHSMPRTGYKSLKDRAYNAADRSFKMGYVNADKARILGSRWISFNATPSIRKPSVTGRNKKFVKEIAPGRYDMRTSWGKAARPGFTKVIKVRKHRMTTQTHWRHAGKAWIPK